MLDILLSMVETDEEREIITKLFETYRQRMYNLTYSILHNTHDAEDAVSNAFIRIMNNLHKISDTESSKTKAFIYIVTKNAALDIYKKRKKNIHTDIDESEIADVNDIEDDILKRYNYSLIDTAIKNLSDSYREILILRYFYDLTIDNISRTLGISENAAKHRLYRAQESLLKKLGGSIDE